MNSHKEKPVNIERVLPRENLRGMVLAIINAERKRLAKIRLFYTSAFGLVSLLAVVPVTQYFLAEFSQSGFYQYLSLIFSDGSTALANWKELTLSLLESLPVTSMTIILVIIFALVVVTKFIIRDFQIIFNKTQLA